MLRDVLKRSGLLGLLLALTLPLSPGYATSEVGEVVQVRGNVSAQQADGVSRTLSANDPIFEGGG